MSVKLIVCDIEGCLMPADKGAAGPSSLLPIAEYCRQARTNPEKFPPFVLCTGRQAPYAECLAQIIGAFFPGFPGVVENGAFIYDIAENRLIPNPHLPKDFPERRIELMKMLREFANKTLAEIEAGKEICISLNPPKNVAIEEFYKQVKEFLGDAASGLIVTHSRSAVDITPLGINKAAGIKHLAEYTGIAPGEMLGIGDTSGDMPMLKLVGHAACPANATDDVKAVCEYVATQSEAKGIAEIIGKYTKPGVF